MIALEYLVIGEAGDLQVIVDEAFVNGMGDGGEGDLGFQVFENGMKPFQLPGVLGKEVKGVFFPFQRLEVADKEIELPVERGLWLCMEFDNRRMEESVAARRRTIFHEVKPLQPGFGVGS